MGLRDSIRKILEMEIRDAESTESQTEPKQDYLPGARGTLPDTKPQADAGPQAATPIDPETERAKIASDLEQRVPDLTVPFSERATQLAPGERTDQYKSLQRENFDKGIRKVEKVMTNVVDGHICEYGEIREIVRDHIATLAMDKSILLNLGSEDKGYEEYLFNHSLGVALIGMNIGLASGMNYQQILEIGEAAILSDIGMLTVPDSVRFKQGMSDATDTFEIQKHPIMSLKMLEKVSELPEVIRLIVYQHHERMNGTGYPKKRGSRFIHEYAKILSIADVYKALTSSRPHRQGKLPFKAMENMIKMTRLGLFDLEILKRFLGYMSLFPIGSLVKLNTNEICKVVEAYPRDVSRPLLSVQIDSEGVGLGPKEMKLIDLSTDQSRKIVKAVSNREYKIDLMDGF